MKNRILIALHTGLLVCAVAASHCVAAQRTNIIVINTDDHGWPHVGSAGIYPDWNQTEIAASGWNGVNGEIDDLDGDGDNDIVMGGIVWFINPGNGRVPWAMKRIDSEQAHDIELGDLNADGRLDVVARDQSAFGKNGHRIFVYLQTAPDIWKKKVISCPHGEGLKLADIDRDKDLDIIIGGRWFENSDRPDQWTDHPFTETWTEPDTKVEVADFNNDGRPDIVLTPAELRGERYKIAWYESPRDPKQSNWQEHVIARDVESVFHSLGLGDFDNDGEVDIAVAEMHQGADPDEVSLYLNQGKGRKWRKQVLSNKGSHDIVVVDIDRDGDMDIIGANHGGQFQAVELWQNGTIKSSTQGR